MEVRDPSRSVSPTLRLGVEGVMAQSPRSPRSPSIRRNQGNTEPIRRSRSRPTAPLPLAVQMHQDNTIYISGSGDPAYVEKQGGHTAYEVTPVCAAKLTYSRPVGGDYFFRGMAKVRDVVWVAETDGSITVREQDTAEVKRIIHPLENTPKKHTEGAVHVTKDDFCTRAPGHILTLNVVNDRVWGGANDGKVHVYSFSGKREKEFKHHAGPVSTITHSNGNVFAGSCDFKISQYSSTTCLFVRLLHGHRLPVRCLRMVGDILYSGSDDKTIKVWSSQWTVTSTGSTNSSTSSSLLATLTGHRGDVLALEKAKGNMWSGSTDCSIRVWSITTAECVAVLPHHTGWVHTLKEVGGRLWSASHDGSVCIWSAKSISLLHRLDSPHDGLLHGLCITKATSTFRLWTVGGDQLVKFWDVNEGDTDTTAEHWEDVFTAREKTLELERVVHENLQKHKKFTDMLESAHSLLVKERQDKEDEIDRNNTLHTLIEKRDEQIQDLSDRNEEIFDQYAKLRAMSQNFRENVQLMVAHHQEKPQHTATSSSSSSSLIQRLQQMQQENERLHMELERKALTATTQRYSPIPEPPTERGLSPEGEKCRELEMEVGRLTELLHGRESKHDSSMAPPISPFDGNLHSASKESLASNNMKELLESTVQQLSRKCSVLQATLPHLDELLSRQSQDTGFNSPRAPLESVRALVEAEAADLGVDIRTEERDGPMISPPAPNRHSGVSEPDMDPISRREKVELEREVQRLGFDLDKVSTSADIKIAQLRQHLAEREEELMSLRSKIGKLQHAKMQLVYEKDGEATPTPKEASDEFFVSQQLQRDSLQLELAAIVAEKVMLESETDALKETNTTLKASVEKLQQELKAKNNDAAEWVNTLAKVEAKIRTKEQEHIEKLNSVQSESEDHKRRIEEEKAILDETVARRDLSMTLSLLAPQAEVELKVGDEDVQRGRVLLPTPPLPRRVTLLTASGPVSYAYDNVTSVNVVSSARGNLREHTATLQREYDTIKQQQVRHAVEAAVLKLIPGMEAEVDIADANGTTTVRGKVLKYSLQEAMDAPEAVRVPIELKADSGGGDAGDVKSYAVSSMLEVRSAVRDFHSFYSKIARIHQEKRALEDRLREVEADVQRQADTPTQQVLAPAPASALHSQSSEITTPAGEVVPDPRVAELEQRLAKAEEAVCDRDERLSVLARRLAKETDGSSSRPPTPRAAAAYEGGGFVRAGSFRQEDRETLNTELTSLMENYKVIIAEVECENEELKGANGTLKGKNDALKKEMVSRVKVIEEGLAATKAVNDRSTGDDSESSRLRAESDMLRQEVLIEVAARESLVQEVQLLKEELTISKNHAQQLASRVDQFESSHTGKNSAEELTSAHQTINSLYAELQAATSQISVVQEEKDREITSLQHSLQAERETLRAARDATTREATWRETQLEKELHSKEAELDRVRAASVSASGAFGVDRDERGALPRREHHTPPPRAGPGPLKPLAAEYSSHERRDRRERERQIELERERIERIERERETPAPAHMSPRQDSEWTGTVHHEEPRSPALPLVARASPSPSPSPAAPLASSGSVRRAQEARQHLHELRAQVDEAQRRANATQEAAEELRVQTRQLSPGGTLPGKVAVLRTIRFKSGKTLEKGSIGTVLRAGDAPDTLRVHIDDSDIMYDFKQSDVTPFASPREAEQSVRQGSSSPPAGLASPVSPQNPQLGPMVRLVEPIQSGTKTWKRGAWAHLLLQDGGSCALQLIHPNGQSNAPPLFAHKVPSSKVEHVAVPHKLRIAIPGKRPASGVYTAVEGVLHENSPVWQVGDRMLQTNQYGAWIIGEKSELSHGVGWAVSKAPHGGVMPHQVGVWQTFGDPSEPWADDPGVQVVEVDAEQQGVRGGGGSGGGSAKPSLRSSRSPSPSTRSTPAGRTLSPQQEAIRAAEALSKLDNSGNWRKRANRARSLSEHADR